MKRILAGALVALGGIAAASAVMVPLRDHLSVATPALVLVVPVVAGVTVGGVWSGAVGLVAGFLTYDILFVPPFDTLAVGRPGNWVALFVYAVVVGLVSVVVVSLERARAEAARRGEWTRLVYAMSDLLIGDKPLDELLPVLASNVHEAFGARWAAVLLPAGDGLAVAATAGEPLSAEEVRGLLPLPGRPEHLRDGEVIRVALTARGRPVGLLAMDAPPPDRADPDLLHIYVNHAALALERSQLREQAVRTELLEKADRWRDALMGAVSHDLRTPLASVKSAVTTLRRDDVGLTTELRDELLELIEEQSDALERLVTNLLDMTRIQAGALAVRPEITPVADVVEGALRVLGLPNVDTDLPADLPPVEVDQLLMQQVVANLVDNALRYSDEDRPVRVAARAAGAAVQLVVEDHGPGIPPAERTLVFEMFSQAPAGGRAGLGLAIAKAFVEAHGQTIWVEDALGGGARFVVTMPVATRGAATGPADAA